jgi:hypothetical protein
VKPVIESFIQQASKAIAAMPIGVDTVESGIVGGCGSLYASSNIFAAGETGSITLASERVYISQPSISTAISHLERELGVQLFIRHHAQGLSLTPFSAAW